MADLPDYYTQAQLALSYVVSMRGGDIIDIPGTPSVGDVYVAFDEERFYVCYVAGDWTEVTGAFLPLAGGAMLGEIDMAGERIIGVADPIAVQDAATRAYVLAQCGLYLPLAGGHMTGAITMDDSRIVGLPEPVVITEATTKGYVDALHALCLLLTGGAMTGAIAMGANKITGLADPTLAQDAATKAFVEALGAIYLLLAGGTMAGNIIMGGNKLTGLGAPAAAGDSLRYGNAEIRNAEIAVGAAIAYAKLNLALSIVNADVNAAAAIDESKLALNFATHAAFTAANHTAIGDGAPHHAEAHDLASHTTKAHNELTGVTAAQHHAKYTNANAVAAVEAAGLALASGKNIKVISALTTDRTQSGLTAVMTAGEETFMGLAYYLKSDGKLWRADKDSATTMPAIALALGTVAADAAGEFLLQGFRREDLWGWTVGGLIYVADAGAITQDVSGYTTGDQVQVVGVAITADIIYFNPSLELVEVA